MERLVTDAIVLSTGATGEADRVVTLLTATHGRLTAFAAHARRSRRRFGGALDPFTCVRAALVERRAATYRLDETAVLDAFEGIRTDLARIGRAGCAVELSRELCRDGEPHPELYAALRDYLARLSSGGSTTSDLLRFELAALAAVGLAPRLDRCARCGAADADRFDAAAGGAACARCAPRATRPRQGTLAVLLRPAGDAEPDARTRAEARDLVAAFVQHHVGVRLKSRRFLDALGVE